MICPGCLRLVHRCNCEQRVLRRWLLAYAALIVLAALIKVLGSFP